MRIEVIKTHEAFANLKEDWEAVYAADPDAQFFLSWTWLSGWLRNSPKWFVIVAKLDASSPPVAFFPIRLRVERTFTGEVIKEVVMAGSRAADYTGFICRPEYDDKVIPAFAVFIKTIKWDRLHLENICLSQKRIMNFLSFFASENFEVKIVKFKNAGEDTDNYRCPYVTLPGSWDAYLEENLGKNTRQKVRRFLRKVDSATGLRISQTTASTIDRDLDILFHLWVQKWGERKGDEAARIEATSRVMLMHCFEAGALLLPVCWQEQVPVGALAILIDKDKRSLLFFIGGRDEAYKNPPPGFILHAYSLRLAVNNSFKTYDFLKGNEPYKYVFGCQERRIWYIVVSARSAQASAAEAPLAHARAVPA